MARDDYFDGATIAAIGTPPGRGGVGIIRLSGPQAVAVGLSVFRFGPEKAARQPAQLTSHLAVHGWVVLEGQPIDDGLFIWFQAPNSFTGEEVVELQLHGSPRVLDVVLGHVLSHDAVRLARAGEYTQRALMHGRLDLSQAEAIADLIDAKTALGAQLAAEQLSGEFGQRVREMRTRMAFWLAHLEALLDFPEDQVPEIDPAAFDQEMAALTAELQATVERSRGAWVYRDGLRVAIVGRPNRGKSSLFNCLLERERAIVSEISGTTRDVLEEGVDVGGVPVILTDTAGITESEDTLERMGIERSLQAIREADLLLVVLDASEAEESLARFLQLVEPGVAELVETKPRLLVWNKLDQAGEGFQLPEGAFGISVREATGLDQLKQAIVAEYQLAERADTDWVVTNVRQQQALREATGALARLQQNRRGGLGWDTVAFELKEATDQLGRITGATVESELHDQIFSRFCIGK